MGIGFIKGIGEVYFVPDATLNLLSILYLTRAGNSVTFTNDKVFLNGKPIGQLDGKLYYKNVGSDFCSPSVAEDESFYDDKINLLNEDQVPPIH